MVTLDQLPNEVFHAIASSLHKRHDLAALCQVSRHCRDVANPILWNREVKSDRPGALHWAVEHDNLDVVKRALEAGVNPNRIAYSHKPKSRIDPKYKWWNYHSSYYDDPTWQVDDEDQSVDLDTSYVRHDHCNCFEGGCDDGIFNDCSWQPIHIAASKGRIDVIDLLLEKGAEIDGMSWGFCICRPHLPIEAFAESRAVEEEELEDLHGGGWTPLHIAICHGQMETAKHLLTKGASYIIYQGIDFELDETALEPPAGEQNADTKFSLTAMHHAAKHNQLELLEFIVDKKFQTSIDCQGPFMGTPLFQSIWYRHWDTIVPWLLQRGANIDTRLLETQLTPLMNFCYQRRFDDAARLVDLGADVAIVSIHNFTILHLILGPGSRRDEYESNGDGENPTGGITELELIEKFLAKGFPVDAREAIMGMTPLMVASASCNVDAIKALITGGANVNIVDRDGLSILARLGEAAEGSAIGGLHEAGKALLDAGISMKDSVDQLTPLNIICARQCESFEHEKLWETQHALLAKLLIERGADPNDKGVSATRPFTDALLHCNFVLATAILECGGRPELNEVDDILDKCSDDMYDGGKTKYIVGLDWAKYGMSGPSEAFLSKLLNTALEEQLWTRVSDLIAAAPRLSTDIRKGLIHRCLLNATLSGDDPSRLVQTLLDLGENPDELWEGEPPIYFSIKSGYCWRSTPVLVNAGANIHMATKCMPDGAFMYSINQKYHSQTLQMLVKDPSAFASLSPRLHQETWASLIRERTQHPTATGNVSRPPNVYWKMAQRMMHAGLRTDVTMKDGRPIKEIIEQAIPKGCYLDTAEQDVLERFGIPYTPPVEDICEYFEGESDEDGDRIGILGDMMSNDGDWDDDDEDEDDDEDDDDDELDLGYSEDDDEDEDDEDGDDIGFPPMGMPLVFGFLM
ncbi:hypothetical protein BGZ63DRAFT_356962 [Mariannaea sp. PMI_226]|nr:hypothetical protein BGZ63DRAFT_356962 [Mariannaea sp. PMI_226]